MNKISIAKSCKKCERSSTFIKKRLGRKGDYFVCSVCGFKLCPAHEIMDHAFPKEEKPISGIGRQHTKGGKKKKKYHSEDTDW